MQTFQAVHDLHSLGYLHRNINPTKFVFGLENPQIVLLVGFSRSLHFQRHYDVRSFVHSLALLFASDQTSWIASQAAGHEEPLVSLPQLP